MARERAQLILIAGVGIAVTFVALALILNTVIYTQNLATRSTVDGADAITTENAVLTGVDGLISKANYYDYDAYNSLDTRLNSGVSALSLEQSIHSASHGVLLDVTLQGTPTRGTHVVQEDQSRALTSANGETTWALAKDVDRVRAFHMNLTTSSLDSASGTPLELRVGPDTTGTLVPDWSIQIRQDSGTPVLVNSTGATCTGSGSYATVDFTERTFDGERCLAIGEFTTEPDTYRLLNADKATGRYTLIVSQDYATFQSKYTTSPYSGTVHTSPYAVRALYDATVRFTYRADDIHYTDTATLAPEHKPGGEPYTVAEFRQLLNYVTNTGGTMNTYYPNGTTRQYAVPSGVTAEVIGPDANIDTDEATEIPVVYSNASVGVVDVVTGEYRTLTTTNAKSSKSLLWTGSFRGAQTAVWFAGGNGAFISNVTSTGVVTQAYDVSSNGISAVVGAADITGDGANELVYTDGSAQLRYVSAAGTTEVKITNGGTGTNYGPGAGRPHDFDGDGTARVPFVDGSNNLKLVDGSGNVATIVSGNVAKAPVGVFDVDADDTMEIVFLRDGSLHYVNDVTGTPTTSQLTDANGDPVMVSSEPGAA